MTAAAVPSFLTRLRERGVIRVATSYGVIAWLTVQIASVVLPTFHLPEWSMEVVVVVAAFGFVVACVLAWFLEVTPQGIEVDRQDAALARSRAVGWRRYFDVIVIAALVIVVAVLLIDRNRRAEIGAHADKSVAVLPFVNMSGDPDNTYFSDGLSDAVINGLAQLQGLRVTARTSSFKFRGQEEDVRVIGAKLGVATLIEGSVQRSGDKLRVIAQLISTADGTHIWSKTFDRSSSDVFAVQDEIAAHIADALKISLLSTQGTRPRSHGTDNAEAFDAYARARALLEKRSGEATEQALQLLRHALELDPDFALAQARLAFAMAFARNYNVGGDITNEDVQAAAKRALEMAPDLSEAYVALGLAQQGTGSRAEIESVYRRAVALNPNSAEAVKFLAAYVPTKQESLELIKRAQVLDPLSPIITCNVGDTYGQLGDEPQMLYWIKRCLALDPQFFIGYQGATTALMNLGKLADAARWARAMSQHFTDERALYGYAWLQHALLNMGDHTGAREAVRHIEAASQDHALIVEVNSDLFLAGADPHASALILSGASLDRGWSSTNIALLLAMSDVGRSPEVLEQARTALPTLFLATALSEDDLPYLAATAVALRKANRSADADALLRSALRYLPGHTQWELASWNWCAFLWNALLGDTEGAVIAMRTAMEAGIRAGVPYLPNYTRDPNFARVWKDSRVQAMVAQMKVDIAKQLADYQRNPELPPGTLP